MRPTAGPPPTELAALPVLLLLLLLPLLLRMVVLVASMVLRMVIVLFSEPTRRMSPGSAPARPKGDVSTACTQAGRRLLTSTRRKRCMQMSS